MLIALKLPVIATTPVTVAVRAIHIESGQAVDRGAPLADIRVDFSAGLVFDCPPISFYRLVAHEGAEVCHVTVAVGDAVTPDTVLAVLTTESMAPRNGAPERDMRAMLASILSDGGWWDDPA